MPLFYQLESRARHGRRVDAAMLVEALILVGEEHFEEPRIDVLDARRQPPAPLGGGIGAQ